MCFVHVQILRRMLAQVGYLLLSISAIPDCCPSVSSACHSECYNLKAASTYHMRVKVTIIHLCSQSPWLCHLIEHGGLRCAIQVISSLNRQRCTRSEYLRELGMMFIGSKRNSWGRIWHPSSPHRRSECSDPKVASSWAFHTGWSWDYGVCDR